MATLTDNLKLAIEDNITNASRANLLKLDELAGVFNIVDTGNALVKATNNILILPSEGTGGGTVSIGQSGADITLLDVYATSVDFNGATITNFGILFNDLDFTGSDANLIENFDTAVAGTPAVSSNTAHAGTTGNPHSTTASQVGAYSTSEVDTLLADKTDNSAFTAHTGSTFGVHGTTGTVVGTSDSQVLTNKTIDSDNNSISNIVNADVKATAAIQGTKISPDFGTQEVVTKGGLSTQNASNWKVTHLTNSGQSSDYSLTWPTNLGNPAQVLSTNGVGDLFWQTLDMATNTLLDEHMDIGDASDVRTQVDTGALGDILADTTNGLVVKSTADIGPNSIEFNTSPTVASPTAGQMWWNTLEETANLQLNSDVRLQIGQEDVIRGVNTTGTTLSNGEAVFVNSASGGMPTFARASSSNISGHRVVGIMTEDVLNGQQGFATCRGLLRDVDTSSWVVGTSLFVDSVAGGLTSSLPATPDYPMFVGIVMVQNASTGVIWVDIRPGYYLENLLNTSAVAPSTGQILQFNGTVWEGSDTFLDYNEPTGFLDRTETTISFTEGTRTFTITPTGADFNFYQKGIKYTKSSLETVVVPDLYGLYVIYYEDGVLSQMEVGALIGSGINLFRDIVFVAYVLWDAAIDRLLALGDERHGVMPWETHQYLHETEGTRYESGLEPTVDSTDTAADEPQVILGTGTIWDEDIEINIAAQGTDTSTDPAQIPIFYKEGASGSFQWKVKAPSDFIIIEQGSQDLAGNTILTGGTFPAYNELTGGSWQLTEISGNNQFFLMHLFATDGLDDSGSTGNYVFITGEDEYNNLAQARAAAPTEIAAIVADGLPLAEFRAVATFILQSTNNGSNTVACYARTDGSGNDFIDFRVTQTTTIGSGAAHGGLSGLGNDDHTQYTLLAGRAGGQTLIGGSAASENLALSSTSDATKGEIQLDSKTVITKGTTGVALDVILGAGINGDMVEYFRDGTTKAFNFYADGTVGGSLGIFDTAGTALGCRFAGDTDSYIVNGFTAGASNAPTPGHNMEGTEDLANNWCAMFRHRGASSPFGVHIAFDATPNNTTNKFFECYDNATGAAGIKSAIYSNGTHGSATNVYGPIISDRRLKENIEDATPKLDDIMKLKVRNFNVKGSDLKQLGFVAQEMKEVFPGMVYDWHPTNKEGDPDTSITYMSTKDSILVPVLVKALQEQQHDILEMKQQFKKFMERNERGHGKKV